MTCCFGCWKLATAVVVIIAAIVHRIYKKISSNLPRPDIDLSEYWGPGHKNDYNENTAISSFKISYSNDVIDKLKSRLDDAGPFAEPIEQSAFEYGFNSKRLEEILNYWKNDYVPKWQERQDFLNKFDQFKTHIQGLNIHYIHVKPTVKEDTKVFPLLLLHGWPGSVREFYEIIPLLTTPSKDNIAFEVIAPSLPGYGFSDGTNKKGLNPTKIAIVMRNLLLRIGHRQFYIQAGDWGSIIGSHLSALFPENVLGYHSNFMNLRTPLSMLKTFIASFYPSYFIDDARYISWMYPFKPKFGFLIQETGYFHIQATKPDTVGIALSNNPVGLAAWILEKFSTGTNHNYRQQSDGGFERDFQLDALLDNVMIYYLTNCITTAVRLYKETFHRQYNMFRVAVCVPAGSAHFKYEIQHQFSFLLKERFKKIVHVSYHENGGHFAAMQLPNILHEDFVTFVKKTF